MRQGFAVAFVAVVFMIFNTVITLFPTTPQTSALTMNYTVVVLGGVLLLALAYYYCPVYGGVHWFRGPIANVGVATDIVERKRMEEDGGDMKEVSEAAYASSREL